MAARTDPAVATMVLSGRRRCRSSSSRSRAAAWWVAAAREWIPLCRLFSPAPAPSQLPPPAVAAVGIHARPFPTLLATWLFVLVGCSVALGGYMSPHHQEAMGGVQVVVGLARLLAGRVAGLGAARELLLIEDAVPMRRYAASGAVVASSPLPLQCDGNDAVVGCEGAGVGGGIGRAHV